MNVKTQRGLLLVALMVAMGALAVGALLLNVGVSSPAEAQSLQTQQPSTPPADASTAETTTPEVSTAETTEQQQMPGSSQLLEKAEREGSVRVIVGLRASFVPEGRLSRPDVANQRAEIESAQAGLQRDLQGTGYQTLREYDTIPFVALEQSPQALQAAQRSPHVSDIVEDRPVPPALAESVPKVQAPTMWNSGYTGAGQTVAVLDTGVDKAHPFLSGKVVEEACYSGNSNCPNGSMTQTGVGSGVHCTYAPLGCRHGTHVAGIAAGKGTNFSGVAKGASLMAVQVFSRFTGANCSEAGEDPCTLTYTSDQIAGLERVYDLRSTRSFSSVNMSLGGGRYYSNCDTDPRKAIIDNLRSVRIPTVISSMNNSYTDSMGAPACISSAVSVGSTTKSDAISSFSNSASFLSLLAPGTSIYSSVPGGGYAYMNGTSMAAPHVAGAWALLKQKTPSASVDSVLSALKQTGTPVKDTRVAGGVTKPRINIADAAGVSISGPANDAFASSQTLTGANATATGTNVNATKEAGEPNHASNAGGKSVWYKWTPQASGTTTINTAGSNFDTLLAVYTGGAVNSLSQVEKNDDENNAGGVITSKLSFAATAGTTYRIAVDGYNLNGAGAEAGNITLNLASATTNLQTVQENDRDHTSYGNWAVYKDTNFSGGYSSYANATGSATTFKFTGTNVSWKTQKLSDGGITDVYLDGTKVATFDGYSATPQYNVTGYTKSGLASATHTLKLVVTGRKNANSSNTYTEIDRFLVGSTTYEENSFKIAYVPWSGVTNSSASGSTYRQSASKTIPAYFFYFTGPQVDLITAKGPTRGQATVKVIDNATNTVAKTVTLNLNASTVQWQARQSITGLDPAKTYYLQVLSADGTQVVVDAYGAALAPQSQQPASASGGAGEESGAVIEKVEAPQAVE